MNSTTFEDFTSETNTTRLTNLCVSSLNIDPTQEFLSILQGISLSVFNVEGATNSLDQLNNITTKEVSKYILSKRRDLLFTVISPKKYYENILLSTESPCVLPAQDITTIFLDELTVDYSSGHVVNSGCNTISFKERLAPEKDLWSEPITIHLDPGNYTQKEYLEELEDLMSQASKVKNFYNFFYDTITSKVAVFTTTEKLESPTRRKVRGWPKQGDFLILKGESTTLNLLGFSQSFEEPGNTFTGKTRMKYYPPASFHVQVLNEDTEEIIFDFEVSTETNKYSLNLAYDLVSPVRGLITRVFPEDTELSISGRIEYISPS